MKLIGYIYVVSLIWFFFELKMTAQSNDVIKKNRTKIFKKSPLLFFITILILPLVFCLEIISVLIRVIRKIWRKH